MEYSNLKRLKFFELHSAKCDQSKKIKRIHEWSLRINGINILRKIFISQNKELIDFFKIYVFLMDLLL